MRGGGEPAGVLGIGQFDGGQGRILQDQGEACAAIGGLQGRNPKGAKDGEEGGEKRWKR